jgi:peptidoglycan hydrolase-like protein with peptidoglycan-binding domain
MAFQREFGLLVDGIIGAITWNKIIDVANTVRNEKGSIQNMNGLNRNTNRNARNTNVGNRTKNLTRTSYANGSNNRDYSYANNNSNHTRSPRETFRRY